MKYLILFYLIFCISVHATQREDLEVNLAKLPTGQHIRVEWFDLPVLILKPNSRQIESIKQNKNPLSKEIQERAFQNFAKSSGNVKASILYDSTMKAYNEDSLLNPYPLIVLLGVSPNGGCSINGNIQNNSLEDPCRKSTYSLDGRVLHSSDYFTANLFVPSYFVKGNTLIINAPKLVQFRDFSPDILSSNLPKETKLWDSISWNKLDVLKHLINEDKSLLSAKTSVNCNPLHVASGKSPELLSYLIDEGVSTTHICNNGYSPIMISLLVKNNENARILLEHGAKIDAYCEDGNCAKSLKDYLYSDLGYTAEYAEKLIKSIEIAKH